METCFDKEINIRRGDTPDVQNCSRPTSTGSKTSLHTPDPTMHLDQDDRKRAASPVSSPVIPAKKHNFESEGRTKEPNTNKPKEKFDEARKWQDEISSGFDRLVALASEVDKRRRSIENSPGQPAAAAVIASPSEISSTSYDAQAQGMQENKVDSHIQDMQKFKYSEASYNLVTSIQNQYAISSDANRQTNEFMSNMTTSPHTVNLPNANSNQFVQCSSTKLSASGEKLPERHFKKKYFDQEYQKQQLQQLASVEKKVTSHGMTMPNCTNSIGPHSRTQKSPTREYPNQNITYQNSAILSHTSYNQNRPQLHHDQPIHSSQHVHSGHHTHLSQPTHTGQQSHSNPTSQTHTGPPPPGHPALGVQTTHSGHNVHPSHSAHPSQAMNPGNMSHHQTQSGPGEPSHSGQPIHPNQLAHSNHPAHSTQPAHHGQHMQTNQPQSRGGPNMPKHAKYPTQKPIHPSEQHYYGDNYSRHNMYPPYPQGQMRQDQMGVPPGSQNPNYYGPHNYSRQGYPAHYRGRPGYMYQPPPHNSENMHAYRNAK